MSSTIQLLLYVSGPVAFIIDILGWQKLNIDNLLKVVLQFWYLILICKITFILALKNIPFPHFFQSIIMATVISSTHILVFWCFLPKCIHKRNLKTNLLDISLNYKHLCAQTTFILSWKISILPVLKRPSIGSDFNTQPKI